MSLRTVDFLHQRSHLMRGSRKFSQGGGGGQNSQKGSDGKFQHGKQFQWGPAPPCPPSGSAQAPVSLRKRTHAINRQKMFSEEKMKISLDFYYYYIFLLKTYIVGSRWNRLGGSNEYPQCIFESKIRKLGIPL